jgi:predicted nucleic acid-binding protein
MSNGSGLLLLDTNVLVYAHDPRDRRKQAIAADLLDRCIAAERAALSAQNLSEFYVVVTQRLPDRIRPRAAIQQVERLAAACRVLEVTTPLVLEGCRGSEVHRLSFWDALVWAAAKLAQIPYLLTEDAQDGRSIEGVTFLDPFRSEFNAKSLALGG